MSGMRGYLRLYMLALAASPAWAQSMDQAAYAARVKSIQAEPRFKTATDHIDAHRDSILSNMPAIAGEIAINLL